jgi:phosphatidylinositol alpha-1,6-mannosyltransferase
MSDRGITNTAPLILLVTRNFPPLLGGMEKVNHRMLRALQPSWRTALCGPDGSGHYAGSATEVKQSRVKPLPVFLLATLFKALRFAVRCKPTWVIAGSGLTAPIAWAAARLAGGRAAVYLHGLDIVAPSRAYQSLWLPFIRRCDLVLVNSANTAALAHGRGVGSTVTHVLHPGTDLPDLDLEAGIGFRRQHGFGSRPLLLSVGRLTQRKGLVEFVSKALPLIVSQHSAVLLVVIGEEAIDALHARAGSERERILIAARAHRVEENIRFLGRCDDASLSAAFQAASLHVFPVLDLPGDVEGFGMVALESAAHGLPTVAFKVGGVSDAVENGQTGALIEAGDYVALAAAVTQHLAHARGEASVVSCRAFAATKTWPLFGARLLDLLGSRHV